jgi:signal transduction histidine kinase
MPAPTAAPHETGRPRALFALLSSGWHLWLPAVLLALLSIIVTMDLDDWLEGRVPHLAYVLISRTLGAALLVIPIILYLVWRGAAQREKLAREELQAAVELRDDLTNMLVHDLKTPIVSSGMALRMLVRLQAADERDSAHEKDLLKLALDSHRRMDAMVQDILDVARAEGRQMPLNLAAADLLEVVRQAVAEVRPRAQERSVQLREHYGPAPVLVVVDADKIGRVVNNLLENALKFTPVAGDIEVFVAVEGAKAKVSLRDSGEGVPPDLQDRIFEKFSQGEKARKAHRRSVGLGLTFCKLAVEAHGGRIWVESVPGDGSVFSFTVPLNAGARPSD